MNYWIITVKNPYCDFILRGMKTMELRKSVPSTLRPDDIIFIVRKGDRGSIVGACRVVSILTESVSYLYTYHFHEHRVSLTQMKACAGDLNRLVGIDFRRIKVDTWCLNVRSFGFERAPQHFYRIRPEYKSTIERVLTCDCMIEPELGEKVTINGVTYECNEPRTGRMWDECDMYHDMNEGCLNCKVHCNAYYRKDGKHIILKRTSR